MLDSFYQITLKLLKNHFFGVKTSRFCHLYGRHYVSRKSVNHYSCIDFYSYSCLHPLSNERKSMFKSGDSRAV